MAVVTSRCFVSSVREATDYLRQQGYTLCCGSWMRGKRGYARLKHVSSGIWIYEGDGR